MRKVIDIDKTYISSFLVIHHIHLFKHRKHRGWVDVWEVNG